MPNRDDIIRDAMYRLMISQQWIEAAEKDNATNTLPLLILEYKYQKALLQNLGTNLDEIDWLKK